MIILLIILAIVFVIGIIALVLKDNLGRAIDSLEINAFKPVADIKKDDKK